ncbi:hypothetical protein KJ966_28745 [bacterium]|nr:hypothetical protein [bacterium]
MTILLIFLLIVGVNDLAFGDNTSSQKVLYVASYSFQYAWSSEIKAGIESVLKSRKNVQFRPVSMDTMGMTSSDTVKIKKAALGVKELIESWKPDIVIASDDNASKYLIVPYFIGSDLPFVFCGVNWDASKYGFPTTNVTGMIEVQLADQLIKYLSPYAKGNKIGSIRGDTMTNRTEAKFFEELLGVKIKTYFVDNIAEWKIKFVQLHTEVDMILVGDIDAVKINDEPKKDVEKFMLDHTTIPTGCWDAHYKNNSLITVGGIPKEQGEYAAQAALEILDGKSPMDIPIVRNKKAIIYLNMKLAKKLGIIFPMDLIDNAQLIPAN